MGSAGGALDTYGLLLRGLDPEGRPDGPGGESAAVHGHCQSPGFCDFFFKQQQFISHSCEGWEARDQGISVVTPR